MSTFEEEIYLYLTKPENFETAAEVYQQFPKVRETLILDFWNEAKEQLESLVGVQRKWTIGLSEEVISQDSSLWIYINDNFGVSYDSLSENSKFGFWFNSESDKLDIPKIKEYSQSIKLSLM